MLVLLLHHGLAGKPSNTNFSLLSVTHLNYCCSLVLVHLQCTALAVQLTALHQCAVRGSKMEVMQLNTLFWPVLWLAFECEFMAKNTFHGSPDQNFWCRAVISRPLQ